MQAVIFATFENQLKTVGKKYKFDPDKFFKNLCIIQAKVVCLKPCKKYMHQKVIHRQ